MNPILKSFALLLVIGAIFPAFAEPIKVVASFSILGDMVRQVGGDQVNVVTLVGPNSDAHLYQPTPSDAKAIIGADLIVVNGLGFEPWFERLRASTASKAAVLVASNGIVPLTLAERGRAAVADPHAWQNLAYGQRYVDTIARALAAVSPPNAGLFEVNAAAYKGRLAALDRWAHAELDAIPVERRKIITSHDAFGYFAQAYGLDILAPVGISTDAEPTAKRMAALIHQMKSEQVHAVFLENMVDPRLVEQIARDSGGVAGGTLYADALSAANGPAASYEAMFRHNVNTLTAALRVGN